MAQMFFIKRHNLENIRTVAQLTGAIEREWMVESKSFMLNISKTHSLYDTYKLVEKILSMVMVNGNSMVNKNMYELYFMTTCYCKNLL